MGESIVLEHIRSWQAAGLIDEAVASRLRDAEAQEPRSIVPADVQRSRPLLAPGGLSVVEALVWLGVGLLLVAWYWELASRAPAFGTERRVWFATGIAIPAVLAAVAGLITRDRGGRLAHGTGLLLAAAGVQIAFVGYFIADAIRPGGDALDLTLGALAWVVAAAGLRRLHAGISTTAGLVAAIVTTAGYAQDWVRGWLFGQPDWAGDTAGGIVAPGPILPFLGAAWWLVAAGVVASVAALELRALDPGAGRRGFATRVTAGLVAVLGVAASLLGTGWSTGTGMFERLDPYVGDSALLVVAAVLVGLAAVLRTDAWLYPAALGIVVGLSDLNAQYLASGLGMPAALVVEGAVLIGAGAGTELARRRLARSRSLAAAESDVAGAGSVGAEGDPEP